MAPDPGGTAQGLGCPPSVHQEGWAKHSLIQALAFVPQITEIALEPGTGEVIGHCEAGVSVCPYLFVEVGWRVDIENSGPGSCAKCQLTWFRKEPMVHWLPGFGDDAAIAAAAERLVAGHLRSSAAP